MRVKNLVEETILAAGILCALLSFSLANVTFVERNYTEFLAASLLLGILGLICLGFCAWKGRWWAISSVIPLLLVGYALVNGIYRLIT